MVPEPGLFKVDSILVVSEIKSFMSTDNNLDISNKVSKFG